MQNNTFQAVFASNNESSFILFLYGEIQWSTGDDPNVNDGVYNIHFVLLFSIVTNYIYSTKGDVPMPATVGLNAGDGSNFTILPHSNTDAVINISSTTNINMTGIWVFQVDQVQI